jgi:anti-anti-sigma factor
MKAASLIMIDLPEAFGAKEARKLERELRSQITKEALCVIVDLSRVKKMDSAGLDGLLACMQEISNHDGSVQLRAISPEAATLLEIVRMDRLFEKFPPLPAPASSLSFTAPIEAENLGDSIQPHPVTA